MSDSEGRGLHAAGPFSNHDKSLPPLHVKLMAALGMQGLASNGLLAKVTAAQPADRRIARLALWTVEHQFLQVCAGSSGALQGRAPRLQIPHKFCHHEQTQDFKLLTEHIMAAVRQR